jgi:SAM-dependent methyltransferase
LSPRGLAVNQPKHTGGTDVTEPEVNAYSYDWFEAFVPGADERTADEVRFLARHLPVARFPRVLDLCCGTGRHAAGLAGLSYRVTGLDRSDFALERARRLCGPTVQFVEGDMRELDRVPGTFDAVISMWQSFGYFDRASNLAVLDGIRRRLREGGRVVLDIYDRRFFERNHGSRRIERDGEVIEETTELVDGRLTVRLDYESRGVSEAFEWELYSAEELAELASSYALILVQACAGFDEGRPARGQHPRMQLVFEFG